MRSALLSASGLLPRWESVPHSRWRKLGEIHGMLDALGIPYQLVIPQKWKAFFGVTADKNTSIACAHRLFPKVSLRKTERCKKDHDGLAEALLMASYARHLNKA